jgi:DNA-binding CsgD family transcriptional regulator
VDFEITDELRSRFNAKWSRNRDSGCWEWTASLAGVGYGQLKLPLTRKQIYAHRLSYLMHLGEIPEGQYVLHRCDNPKCVNPEHLWLGTQKDNLQDMKRKDRHLRGERNSSAVLTPSEVRSIRLLCSAGDLSQQRIAKMFGIQQMQVSRIHRRERWAHILDEPCSTVRKSKTDV